ncbi:hypothetical protein ACQJBY_040118 [Aegilops geniculata]
MEGAAQVLVSNVGQLVGKEFRQLRGVGGEVARLRDELATMNALLRMQSEAEEGAVDHFVREWMKQLREVAYDAEDCVDLYLFRVRCRSGDRYFFSCKRLLGTLLSRRRLAGDIRDLRAHAAAINEQHARYGVNLDPLRRPPSVASLRAVAVSARALRHADDPSQFVGIVEQATPLAQKIKLESTDKSPKVISIVGFGGLGKTTLAMEVCRQLEPDFQRQAQVSVSQAFDGRKGLTGLLIRVLQQIAKPKSDNPHGITEEDSMGDIDGLDEEKLAVKLKELVENKRYLIVIDDVWTVAAWDVIWAKLPHDNCSSRIIVTTRIDTVAKACSGANGYVHNIKALNLADSKKLFLSRAFGSTSDSCPNDMKEVMEKVLRKCGGLPLAIISIASLLASYNSRESKHMWETIFKSIGSQMDSHPTLEGMRQIVTLSFDHLPHHLKLCIMYVSIFPEDYVIAKDRLLMRWIAEGLVAEKRGLTLMEVAESYFNELVSRSMIDRAPDISNYYDGRVETCRVHDMMLEVMVSKSLEANFVSLIGGQYEEMCYDRIRRLSVHGGGEVAKDSQSQRRAVGHGWKNGIKGMNVQHARSLSVFEFDGAKQLLGRLGEFTLLRVLDLEDCKGLEDKHMRHICRMYLLRFLSLKGTDIKKLPSKVGKLEHLQTLDVRHTGLLDLPESVTDLEELESLQFTSGWTLPEGVKKMKSLRKANKVIVRSNLEAAREIAELEQLQDLCIYIDSRSDIHQHVHLQLIKSIGKLYSLRCLNIGDFGHDPKVMDFLHELSSPPRLLRYLRINGGLVQRGLPAWVGLLTNLVEFVIAWASLKGDQLFDILSKLPILRILTLEYAGAGLVAGGNTHIFPELTDLTLAQHPQNPDVYGFEKGCMPKLERLSLLINNEELEIVGIENLAKLKEVSVTGKKDNEAMKIALEELKKENQRRDESNQKQFTVKVTYV